MVDKNDAIRAGAAVAAGAAATVVAGPVAGIAAGGGAAVVADRVIKAKQKESDSSDKK